MKKKIILLIAALLLLGGTIAFTGEEVCGCGCGHPVIEGSTHCGCGWTPDEV